jgi:polyisoprenoid-binding protein YceI
MKTVRMLAVAMLFAACGGGAALSTSPAATQPATLAPKATASAVASSAGTADSTAVSSSWNVAAAGSKAVVSVREQLVGVSLPSDAVLTATGATGTFALKADGAFSTDSKITFDLTTLASDSRDRDNFVKQDTLQIRQFPKAEFVPTRTSGLALPLASGTSSFKLTGNLTIHGKTKEVTFDVVAKRTGGDLTATATLAPTFKFGDFGMSAPSVPFRVVSVVDEIRLVVELVATAAGS